MSVLSAPAWFETGFALLTMTIVFYSPPFVILRRAGTARLGVILRRAGTARLEGRTPHNPETK
jgi:hypothetical protein